MIGLFWLFYIFVLLKDGSIKVYDKNGIEWRPIMVYSMHCIALLFELIGEIYIINMVLN